MFLVSDKVPTRRKKIERFLQEDKPVIATLLAAADCERTIRRAILNLGITPTKELAHRLGRPRSNGYVTPKPRPKKYGSTINGYREAWNDEVEKWLRIPLQGSVITRWPELVKAFQLRHDLIHGDTGTTGLAYASTQVEVMLQSTAEVDRFAMDKGYDLTANLKKRLKPREIE